MPLSKARNRERMRRSRLHKLVEKPSVQPILDAVSPSLQREGYGKASSSVQPRTIRIDGRDYIVPELDADGNPIPEI